jgi:hypothetical protein
MRRAVVFKALYLMAINSKSESGPVVRPDCAAAHLMALANEQEGE